MYGLGDDGENSEAKYEPGDDGETSEAEYGLGDDGKTLRQSTSQAMMVKTPLRQSTG